MRIPAAILNPSRARTTGLPAFTGGRRPVGATRQPRGSAMSVVGSPSMRVIREPAGGTKTLLRRNMEHADLLSDSDLQTLRKLMEAVESSAKGMSRGGLSKRDLRRMGHPYAKGSRKALGRLRGSGRGVSNMAITNMHSGHFARSWDGELMRDKSGVTLALSNDAEYSAFLAFGTRKMRAHGSHTTAMAKHLSAIDAEWRRLGRVASQRAQMLDQLGMAAREQRSAA